jgi:hypothetical protein
LNGKRVLVDEGAVARCVTRGRRSLPADLQWTSRQACLYLMRNGYATGQILHVEGGSALSR